MWCVCVLSVVVGGSCVLPRRPGISLKYKCGFCWGFQRAYKRKKVSRLRVSAHLCGCVASVFLVAESDRAGVLIDNALDFQPSRFTSVPLHCSASFEHHIIASCFGSASTTFIGVPPRSAFPRRCTFIALEWKELSRDLYDAGTETIRASWDFLKETLTDV